MLKKAPILTAGSRLGPATSCHPHTLEGQLHSRPESTGPLPSEPAAARHPEARALLAALVSFVGWSRVLLGRTLKVRSVCVF